MSALTAIRTAALGAAAMYLLDPDRGRRRRAIARDKVRSLAYRAGDLVDAAKRDASHRLEALHATARRLRTIDDAPSDEVLVERVRARLGRVVSHPHAVRVVAESGRVRLVGPILACEHLPLITAMRTVRGVREVDDDALALHERPDGISALQGGSRRAGSKPEILKDNWAPAVRVAAIGGGGALALYGSSRSGLSRVLLSGLGLALIARGATNVPFDRMLSGAHAGTAEARGPRAGTARDNEEHTSDDWTRQPRAPGSTMQPGL
jgi:hypothetical protein